MSAAAGGRIRSMTEVAPGVHFVEGPASNWTVLVGHSRGTGDTASRAASTTAGDRASSTDDTASAPRVVLIDAGYPKDLPLVEESIRRAGGKVDDLIAILITHGHSDHIGTVAPLARRTGAHVYGHPYEHGNITRAELHQIGIGDILPLLWKPRIARWVTHAIGAGGLSDVGVERVQGMPESAGGVVAGNRAVRWPAAHLAGHHIVQIPSAGHTPGHSGYWLPEHGVLVVGDAIVSAHPTTTVTGPQLLPAMWHTDPLEAIRAIDTFIDIDAIVVLPGHGPLLRSSPADVVRRATDTLHAADPDRAH
ncbi:MBL fold metallo-hydrolase [Plantibacter sp. YIM 135347]|uniref:MBL fold metallo-hydrolase n=1 Tax=Plantibacter sp. YIM 135347 TaxID=3423919 RepID=UPI003D3501AB